MGKRLNKLLLLSDLIYTWRSKHLLRVFVRMRSVRICMHVCMYFETGNYDNCRRLSNLPASIIWMGKSSKEEQGEGEQGEGEEKIVLYFFCG